MQIDDIKLRQNLNKIIDSFGLRLLRLTRLSNIDVYEHMILIQQNKDKSIELTNEMMEQYRKRFIVFAQIQFKCRKN